MHSRKYRVVTALERTSSRLILAAGRRAAPRWETDGVFRGRCRP